MPTVYQQEFALELIRKCKHYRRMSNPDLRRMQVNAIVELAQELADLPEGGLNAPQWPRPAPQQPKET